MCAYVRMRLAVRVCVCVCVKYVQTAVACHRLPFAETETEITCTMAATNWNVCSARVGGMYSNRSASSAIKWQRQFIDDSSMMPSSPHPPLAIHGPRVRHAKQSPPISSASGSQLTPFRHQALIKSQKTRRT